MSESTRWTQVQTDRPDVVAAALREATEQYRGDVDDPDVAIDQEDLDHLAEIAEFLDQEAGRDE